MSSQQPPAFRPDPQRQQRRARPSKEQEPTLPPTRPTEPTQGSTPSSPPRISTASQAARVPSSVPRPERRSIRSHRSPADQPIPQTPPQRQPQAQPRSYLPRQARASLSQATSPTPSHHGAADPAVPSAYPSAGFGTHRSSAGAPRPATGRPHPVGGQPRQVPTRPPFPTNQKARRGRPRLARRFTTVALVLAMLLGAWVAFLYIDANRNLTRVDALSGAADTPGTTFLLAGSDARAGGPIQDNTEGARSDSIMLVHIAPNGQTSAISLPRDTWVDIPEYGENKLNAAYSLEGPQLLVSTVEGLTGLTVDHYVEIGMGGVAQIVDAVGGVELCLDYDVDDVLSELKWTAGCHVVDGKTALAFSRMRYSDPNGDIGRAERQRQVVTKTVKTALSPGTLLWPPSTLALERSGASALTTDPESSAWDILTLVRAFRSAGNDGMTGAPPIESLAYDTYAGSAVLLRDTTAPDFFSKLREGTLTPEDFKQDFK